MMKDQLIFSTGRLTVLLLVSFLFWQCQPKQLATDAPAPINQEITSHEGELILVGALDREAWQLEAYRYWFDHEYAAYEVDEATLAGIQSRVSDLEVLVFLGTWCSDSQREVPRFYKVMDGLGFDDASLTVIGLDNHPDRRKQSPQHEEAGWNIEYVPTFIFLRDGLEIGRIIESPAVSLERDLAVILAREAGLML